MFRRCIIDSPSRSLISKLGLFCTSTNSTSLASHIHVSAIESTRARSPAKIRKSMNIKIRGRLSSCRHRFMKFNGFFSAAGAGWCFLVGKPWLGGMACETKLAGWAKFSDLPSVSGAG